jgi:hypothetical protein
VTEAGGFERTAENYRGGATIFCRDRGTVGRASTQPLAVLYSKKESKDVPSPQTQRSNSQSPIIANMASVIAKS